MTASMAGCLLCPLLCLGCLSLLSCEGGEYTLWRGEAGFNGDFETAESGYPVNWTFAPGPQSPDGLQVFLDTTHAVEGRQSLKLIATRGKVVPGLWSMPVPVRADRSYRVTLSVMNPDCALTVNLVAQDRTGKTHIPLGTITHASPATHEWVQLERTVSVPEGAAAIFLQLPVEGDGALWCDNVRIEETTTP